MTLPIHKRSRVRSISSTLRPCRLVGKQGKDHQIGLAYSSPGVSS
jgi:hypothetical protein